MPKDFLNKGKAVEIAPLWNMMEETNAAVMKILMAAKGVPRSRMMILVDGVKEVKEIRAAIEKVENSWEEEGNFLILPPNTEKMN